MPKEMLEHIFNVLAPLGWETWAVDKSFFQGLDLVFCWIRVSLSM